MQYCISRITFAKIPQTSKKRPAHHHAKQHQGITREQHKRLPRSLFLRLENTIPHKEKDMK